MNKFKSVISAIQSNKKAAYSIFIFICLLLIARFYWSDIVCWIEVHPGMASWIQAIGVLATLLMMWIGAKRDKDIINAERDRIKYSELTAIKYYLQGYRGLVGNIDALTILFEMLYRHYEVKKDDNSNGVNGVDAGEVVSCAIDCFKSTKDSFQAISVDINNIDFNERPDLLSNRYVIYVDKIINSVRALSGLYSRYDFLENGLNRIRPAFDDFSGLSMNNYYHHLDNNYSEFNVYADSAAVHIFEIKQSWEKIESELRSLRAV
ncbi:hypothetical protein KW830_08365 [Comamonas sp. CMM03]|uniref:hypothetical protein n=1 Tax=Comamonas sp. CMM03 TaxID=2854781 RepID=UPI001C443604|nr:hypothetical protein [Comamonas sp. CMM03]MBV7418469.1 hypothetical protein [Comamonas sp. CMM03]